MKENKANLDSFCERFDLGTTVFCIAPHGKLRVGGDYRIDGSGHLHLNMDPRVGGRSGFGFSVKCESYDPKTGRSLVDTYYFTLDEMPKYFVTEWEDMVVHRRGQRIGEIIG